MIKISEKDWFSVAKFLIKEYYGLVNGLLENTTNYKDNPEQKIERIIRALNHITHHKKEFKGINLLGSTPTEDSLERLAENLGL